MKLISSFLPDENITWSSTLSQIPSLKLFLVSVVTILGGLSVRITRHKSLILILFYQVTIGRSIAYLRLRL